MSINPRTYSLTGHNHAKTKTNIHYGYLQQEQILVDKINAGLRFQDNSTKVSLQIEVLRRHMTSPYVDALFCHTQGVITIQQNPHRLNYQEKGWTHQCPPMLECIIGELAIGVCQILLLARKRHNDAAYKTSADWWYPRALSSPITFLRAAFREAPRCVQTAMISGLFFDRIQE